MDARQFRDKYGPEAVLKVRQKLSIGPSFWRSIMYRQKDLSVTYAARLAQVSAEVVGPNKEPMTMLDLLTLEKHPPQIIGTAKGLNQRLRALHSKQDVAGQGNAGDASKDAA